MFSQFPAFFFFNRFGILFFFLHNPNSHFMQGKYSILIQLAILSLFNMTNTNMLGNALQIMRDLKQTDSHVDAESNNQRSAKVTARGLRRSSVRTDLHSFHPMIQLMLMPHQSYLDVDDMTTLSLMSRSLNFSHRLTKKWPSISVSIQVIGIVELNTLKLPMSRCRLKKRIH